MPSSYRKSIWIVLRWPLACCLAQRPSLLSNRVSARGARGERRLVWSWCRLGQRSCRSGGEQLVPLCSQPWLLPKARLPSKRAAADGRALHPLHRTQDCLSIRPSLRSWDAADQRKARAELFCPSAIPKLWNNSHTPQLYKLIQWSKFTLVERKSTENLISVCYSPRNIISTLFPEPVIYLATLRGPSSLPH